MDQYLVGQIIKYGLILTRLSGFFITAPIFSSIQIPNMVKVGLLIFCTAIVSPLVIITEPLESLEPVLITIMGFNEIICGLLLGLSLYITFSSIQLAGELVDLRMGFSMVNVLDPQSGENVPITGQLKEMLATLIFLAISGHHYILKGIFASYQVVPLGEFISLTNTAGIILRICGDIFILGLQMALPIVASLFIVDIGFGFLARTIPQINIFSVGFPTKILLGFLILCLSLPNLVLVLESIFQGMFNSINMLLRVLGG